MLTLVRSLNKSTLFTVTLTILTLFVNLYGRKAGAQALKVSFEFQDVILHDDVDNEVIGLWHLGNGALEASLELAVVFMRCWIIWALLDR